MIKKVLLVGALAAFIAPSFSQRNFHVSQYMLHQPLINPAAISSYQGINGALLNRSQWVGFDGAPTVSGVSLNSPIASGNNHLGLMVMHDAIGVNKDINISAQYAYKFQVSDDSYFSLGLAGMLRMVQSDYSQIDVNDGDDDVFTGSTPTFMSPNFSFGMYYFKDRFYIGASSPTILSNKIRFNEAYKMETSFDASELHYNLHAGYGFILSPKVDLNTSTLLKAVSGAPLQADINAQVVFNKKIGIGASYRTSQDIVGIITLQVIKQLKLAYSYDYNMSEIAQFSSGSHEVMLLLDFYEPKKTAAISIPRF